MTDLSYIPGFKLAKLNDSVLRHTQFTDFADLVSIDNNFRPTFYVSVSIPEYVQRDLIELANAYDDHMERNSDPRRIYYA